MKRFISSVAGALTLVSFLSLSACESTQVARTQNPKQSFSVIKTSQNDSRIQFAENELVVDGEALPQLFGAELQYFRMRGGQERDIPREKVIALWNEALDRMVEAGMNTICFYIPWDFHEYEEGKFDFTGTADDNHNGKPDYPSRDLITFFKLIEEHGIKHIMVRPGPYINAEWGFLGFGAIPQWFHDKYRSAHMQSPKGNIAKLYDYHNEDFLRHTKLWFTALYNQVLKDKIGAGKPVFALQVDNETNFQWQSIHNVDYSAVNQERYRKFLKTQYIDLADLSIAHGRTYNSWDQVSAPEVFGQSTAEDRDWYKFADVAIFSYLQKIQAMWLDLGVTHRDVLFTLAESYNAANNGLIPSLDYRNDASTGMSTVNLYPKTDPKGNPLLNNPFKGDHDVRVTDAANDNYFVNGTKAEWVLGPEIQGGWWRGCEVKSKARQQTYLSTIGHGLKALYVYYFNEGDNWDGTWEKKNIEKLFTKTRKNAEYTSLTDDQLRSFAKDRPEIVNKFWLDVSDQYRSQYFFYSTEDKNWAQWTMFRSDEELNDLFFDAPLDKNVKPREEYYSFLKKMGDKIVKAHGEWLGRAVEYTDDIALMKDSSDHAPRGVKNLDNIVVNTEWSSGLYAYLMHAGYNPKFVIARSGTKSVLDIPASTKVLVRYDYARKLDAPQVLKLRDYVNQGGVIVNFLENTLSQQLGLIAAARELSDQDKAGQLLSLSGAKTKFQKLEGSVPTYQRAYDTLPQNCEPVLRQGDSTVAYRCALGKGFFYQIGLSLQEVFNSSKYYEISSFADRNEFLKDLLGNFVKPKMDLVAKDGDASKVVAFARVNHEAEKGLWITLKSGHAKATSVVLKFSELPAGFGDQAYQVEDVLAEDSQKSALVTGDQLQEQGLEVKLSDYDSKVIFIRAQ